jgi:hypothetical protein
MTVKWIACLLLVPAAMALGQAYPATANLGSICDIGAGPAATLLIPYFEVDPADETGPDTLLAVVNLSLYPIVAHVIVWNDDAWSVLNFNIFLTPFDVTTFSLRQLLVHGRYPNNFCGDDPDYRFIDGAIDCDGDGQYLDDAWTLNDGLISLNGSAWDVACYEDASPEVLADWQCKLSTTYQQVGHLVGYVTVDASITCTGGLPDQNFWPWFAVNYLDTDGDGKGDHGALENSNVLLGDIFYLNPFHYGPQFVADGAPAVHIEAFGESNVLPGHTWGVQPEEWEHWGVNTFWFKYEHLIGLLPYDAREPLPVRWAFRYSRDMDAWIQIWRSHNLAFEHWWEPGDCDWGPEVGMAESRIYDPFNDWHGYPEAKRKYHAAPMAEGCSSPAAPPPPAYIGAPLAVNSYYVNCSDLGWPIGDSGWIVYDFATDQDYYPAGYGATFDQSWVTVRYVSYANGAASASVTATPLTNGCALRLDEATGSLKPTPTH